MEFVVRDAVVGDAGACAAIYAPYVSETAITFEETPPTAEQMVDRIETAQRAHAWLVLEDEGVLVGYAYAGPYRARPAYRWACEVSVYLQTGRRGRGAGRVLYTALLDRLIGRGYRVAVAAMTLPNDASQGLHAAMGFEPAGVQRRIGWKHGAWHDIAFAQKSLGDPGAPPSPLT